jgi:hypothetical protein
MAREPEKRARLYAEHLALRVVKRDGAFVLRERYGDQRRLGGPYRSVATLRRAIARQHDAMLRDLG